MTLPRTTPLHGKSLNWACLDAQGLCAIHVRDVLRRWAEQAAAAGEPIPRVHLHHQFTHWTSEESKRAILSAIAHSDTNLICICVSEPQELEGTCKLVVQLGQLPRRWEIVCLIPPDLVDWMPILLEAGAQTVVSQLTFIAPVLSRVLQRIRLSTKGYHPLTSGLVERLPWSESSR